MDHFYQNLLGWASMEDQGELLKTILPLVDNSNIKIVEIGVYRGKGTALWNVELTNLGINYEYHAVDSFAGFGETEEECEKAYNDVLHIVSMFDGTLVKSNSVDAAGKYPDGYFDIIYIDAGHSEEDVDSDIAAWLPKLKPGGVICGDDYIEGWIGVIRSVDKNFGKENVSVVGNQQWWVKI